jgi:hypothetical protein
MEHTVQTGSRYVERDVFKRKVVGSITLNRGVGSKNQRRRRKRKMSLPYNQSLKKPHLTNKGLKCRNEFCNRSARIRGLCNRCYQHERKNSGRWNKKENEKHGVQNVTVKTLKKKEIPVEQREKMQE